MGENLNLMQALYVTISSMAMVFIILLVISGILSLFKYIFKNENTVKIPNVNDTSKNTVNNIKNDSVQENFNIDDEEVMLEQYNLFIETPTNYLQYYLSGFLFEDLYNNASKELGDKFSAVDFHEVILSTGPAPFKILEKQVNKYINSNK